MVGCVLFWFGSMLPNCVVPSAAGDSPDTRFVFVQNLDRDVAIISHQYFLIGKLDASGNLHVQHRILQSAARSRLPSFTVINERFSGKAKAYELRSGRLVPGEIQVDGRFVPDLGSEVIDFKDYRYSSYSVPIYNLPGTFVEVDKLPEKK
jgi:hypothetical protein